MRLTFLWIIGVCLYVSAAAAGVITSGGGDLTGIDDLSAWFLGPRQIRTCVVTSPNFGLLQSQALTSLGDAFNIWKSYLTAKLVNSPNSGEDAYLNGAYGDSANFIYMNYQIMPACDGSEDLKVYFGVQDAVVTKALQKFQDPVGIAVRTSYDSKKGWGKGFIWVSNPAPNGAGPDWRSPYLLRGILLHELGHVTGTGHVADTIMDVNIANYIVGTSYSTTDAQALFSTVDHRRELYVCQTCSFTILGSQVDAPLLGDGFQLLFGRPMSGTLSSSAQETNASSDIDLALRDSTSSSHFTLTMGPELARNVGDAPVFKRSLDASIAADGAVSLATVGYSRAASVKSFSGEVLSLIVNRNMATPLEIRAIAPGVNSTDFIFLPTYENFE